MTISEYTLPATDVALADGRVLKFMEPFQTFLSRCGGRWQTADRLFRVQASIETMPGGSREVGMVSISYGDTRPVSKRDLELVGAAVMPVEGDLYAVYGGPIHPYTAFS